MGGSSLGVFHEFAVKFSARATVIWRPHWDWQPRWPVVAGGRLQFLNSALWRNLEGLHDTAASFPKNKGSDSKVEAAMSFMTQEVTPHHFHNILLVPEVSATQGERSYEHQETRIIWGHFGDWYQSCYFHAWRIWIFKSSTVTLWPALLLRDSKLYLFWVVLGTTFEGVSTIQFSPFTLFVSKGAMGRYHSVRRVEKYKEIKLYRRLVSNC